MTSVDSPGSDQASQVCLCVASCFLQQQYDKCRQPGLRPGLAGLFVCSVVLSTAEV